VVTSVDAASYKKRTARLSIHFWMSMALFIRTLEITSSHWWMLAART
jgi:hypothetical protein